MNGDDSAFDVKVLPDRVRPPLKRQWHCAPLDEWDGMVPPPFVPPSQA